MPIKIFVANDPIELLAAAADTDVVSSGAGERNQLVAATLTNTTAGSITVTAFDSSDSTSASGLQIDEVTLGANETKSMNIVGQSIGADRHLILKGGTSLGDVVAKITVNYADGSS